MAEGRKLTIDFEEVDEVSGRCEEFLCGPCAKNNIQTTADIHCSQCNEFQCTKCSNIHTSYAFMKNHTLVNAKDLKSRPVSYDMKGLDRCQQHDSKLKFLCEDEDVLCCSTCAIANHRKCHSVIEIQTIADQRAPLSHVLKKKMTEVKTQAEVIVEYIRATQKQLRDDVDHLPKKIEDMQEEVNKMFEELKAKIAQEANDFQTKTEAILLTQQTSSEKLLTDVDTSLETIDDVCRKGTNFQRFIIEHKMMLKVKEIQSDIEKKSHELKSATVKFDFDETLKLPPRALSEYIPGRLLLEFETGDKPHDDKATRVNPIINLDVLASIDLKQTGDDSKEPLYSDLDFLPDGRLVVVDNQNMKCLIYNERLEKVGSYQLTYIPQSVVVVSEDEVAITSSSVYILEFYHGCKSNEIKPIRTCKVKTKYESICMKDDENFVVGTVDDTRSVRIVSISGEEKYFNINFPNKKYAIDTSACTYIKSSDSVVLTDRDEHTVYIYDVATNNKVVVKDDQIKTPRGVTEGPAGCILVCSNGTHSLVQITRTGEVLASFKLDMMYPYTVAVSRSGETLAVSNNAIGKKKLQIYKLNVTQ